MATTYSHSLMNNFLQDCEQLRNEDSIQRVHKGTSNEFCFMVSKPLTGVCASIWFLLKFNQ